MGGAAVAGLSLSLAVPLVAGRGPTSLLPPGFGDAPASEEPSSEPPGGPAPAPSPSSPATGARPPLQLDLGGVAPPESGTDATQNKMAEAELSPEELAAQQAKYDLPKHARRSLDLIGPLTPATGGLDQNAFGNESGQYLAALMRTTRAPFVSRWASILLRRTLLSATDTPADITGADWTAERAWLLVRMGEADAARLMVQSVDNDQYSKRLYAVAMQAYLASADPVGLCSLYQGALASSSSPSWRMAEAICASFAAEQGRASAILNQTQRSGGVSGIDYRLTEKLVGAGANARRSVKIEWDGVDRLTSWRFGLATAANVDIPAELMQGAGQHVLAWQAIAPALAMEKRLPAVEAAARLGVLSSAALVDYYSAMEGNEAAPEAFRARADSFRRAYTGPSAATRIDAMRAFWGPRGHQDLAAMLALARAAAVLPVSSVTGADATNLIAAMLSAGHDLSALRWAKATGALAETEGVDGWAMLAVGAPRMVVDISADRVQGYIGAHAQRGRMLLAGLAALGRIDAADAGRLAEQTGFTLKPRTRWEQAIDRAAQRGEKGTVALLAAVGMQVTDWSRMPPEHLYHIVAALHRAGLNPEARMIAAEAIMRS
ncbi:MAG: hypothetical protein B7Z20_04770 [Sphingobium sp. 32-64-5]|nr:MAG: hypothetical protein B7Z20_04770 [Sphingobium sp. 32-64-5]